MTAAPDIAPEIRPPLGAFSGNVVEPASFESMAITSPEEGSFPAREDEVARDPAKVPAVLASRTTYGSAVDTYTDCYVVAAGKNLPLGTLSVRYDPTHDLIVVESPSAQPPLPRIKLEVERADNRFRCKVQPSDRSSDAWVLSTRLAYYVETGFPFRLERSDQELTPLLVADSVPDAEKENIIYFAKLARKIKFLETVFSPRFDVPELYSSRQLRDLELLFRGVTEGEFAGRSLQTVIKGILPAEVDLNSPPFTGPGRFKYPKQEGLQLFGRNMLVGAIVVALDQAEIANHHVVHSMALEPHKSVDVRFMVYDNRIGYNFVRYDTKARKQIQRKLQAFKAKLAIEEAPELVALVDESLQVPASLEEARQVATAWLQYNHFPDRYCSQEPVLDQELGPWRVPIFLAYDDGSGGLVGELTIDVRTGFVSGHTSVDTMRSRGAALSEKLLNENQNCSRGHQAANPLCSPA